MQQIAHKTEGGLLVPASVAVGGKIIGEHIRDGKVIDRFEDHNLVVNEGLNSILDIMFHGSTQIGTWYLGLFEGNYTPVATVTAATIASAATECTAYDEATRQAYDEAAAASQAITNAASRATFTFNATKTVYGAFLISDSTKSGSTGTLFSAIRFGTSKAVVASDQLLLTYQITAAAS